MVRWPGVGCGWDRGMGILEINGSHNLTLIRRPYIFIILQLVAILKHIYPSVDSFLHRVHFYCTLYRVEYLLSKNIYVNLCPCVLNVRWKSRGATLHCTNPWGNKKINVHRMSLFQGYTHLCFYVSVVENLKLPAGFRRLLVITISGILFPEVKTFSKQKLFTKKLKTTRTLDLLSYKKLNPIF